MHKLAACELAHIIGLKSCLLTKLDYNYLKYMDISINWVFDSNIRLHHDLTGLKFATCY